MQSEAIQVAIEAIGKRFSKGAPLAVDNLMLDVHKGEAITLLGPSGCGKSTTLRMIAGLESPDSGRIRIGGQLVTDSAARIDIPPDKRDIGMVFQSYAIWPHMSVGENVAFPLQARGTPKSEISQRTANALAVVGMQGFTDRPATQLSGGQQQRVALARAIVHKPKVLLLDEPLSNLDVKLREQMQVELKAMHRNLGWTVINVTHDQAEAMGVSDRIAVMDQGRIAQVGTPRELYENPATKFVREFLGKSVTLNGEVLASSGTKATVRLACEPHDVLELATSHISNLPAASSVEISIRPEHIHLEPLQARTRALTGVVTAALYQGERTLCEVEVADERILLYLPGHYRQALGQSLTLYLETDFMRVWAR